MSSNASARERVQRLLALHADCEAPAPSTEHLDAVPLLAECARASGAWHLTRDHLTVFGFNVFAPSSRRGTTPAPAFFAADDVFGDADGALEWRDSHLHAGVNCAQAGWRAFAVTSEFDFFFVNVDAQSPECGATRHVLNNCFEDSPFTRTFDDFFSLWERFAAAHHAHEADEFVAFAKSAR
jgi:hypothetical protein